MDLSTLGDNLTLYSALVASIMPAIVAIVNRQRWNSERKGVVAVIISIIAGAGTAFISGNWDSADVVRSVLIVFFLGQLSYQTFWKPTRLGPAIEDATSRK